MGGEWLALQTVFNLFVWTDLPHFYGALMDFKL